jgi:predicted SprT family Zn-dependent metalloprotease
MVKILPINNKVKAELYRYACQCGLKTGIIKIIRINNRNNII